MKNCQIPCPFCGLLEPEALLAAAAEQGNRENYLQQLALLDKYLILSPGNLEVTQQRALLLLTLFNREPIKKSGFRNIKCIEDGLGMVART